MSDITSAVGKKIRTARKEKKLSIEALAELASLHPAYVDQLELGKKNATLATLEKIAGALNMPLEMLLDTAGTKTDVNEKRSTENIPAACYNIINKLPAPDQELLFQLLDQIIHLDS